MIDALFMGLAVAVLWGEWERLLEAIRSRK